MTAILIVSNVAAARVAGLGRIGSDPFVTIAQSDWDEAALEWTDPGYRVTCSADGGTCVRWDLGNTEYPLEDLIEHAGMHVDRHVRGDS
jgi:hypothetical protein